MSDGMPLFFDTRDMKSTSELKTDSPFYNGAIQPGNMVTTTEQQNVPNI
jgi:hypothetical protein